MPVPVVSGGACGPGLARLPFPKAEQLQQVVAGADERPFAVNFLQAPRQELPEAPALLDLAEHRFHRLHPERVALPAPLRRRLLCAALVIPGDRTPAQGLLFGVPRRDPGRLPPTGDRRHSSRKELLGAMARQRLTGEAAPSQTVEQEARFAGVTKRRYQQVLQATREELGLAPPNSGGRPPAAAVQGDAEALDLERMLELQADTIEAPGAGRRPRDSLYALGQRDRRAAVLRFCGRG